MSRGPQWEEEPERGYDDRGYDGPRRPATKSGPVTAVGVVNIVLGGLTAICGLIAMFAGAVIFGGGKQLEGEIQKGIRQAGGNPADAQAIGGLAGILAGAVVVIAVIALLIAVLWILAGIGVLGRKQWARVITLILGAIAGILGVLSLLSIASNPMNAFIGVLLYGGYAVFVYVVLLNARNAAEFR